MTTYKYIEQLRNLIDDNPNIDPYYTNAQLLIFLNNSRQEIARRLSCYENQYYIFPQVYIDEYNLPTDFKQAQYVYDVKNQIEHFPISKPNAESTRTLYSVVLFSNLFYVNETRKKMNFITLPEKSMIPTPYYIKSFDRTNNRIVVNGSTQNAGTGTIAVSGTTVTLTGGSTTQINVGWYVKDSAGTAKLITSITNDYTFECETGLATGSGAWYFYPALSTIATWGNIKPFAKLSNGSTVEYIRVSKIFQSCASPEEYTLVVSSWDASGLYKNDLDIYGTWNLVNGSPMCTSVNAMATTDLAVADEIKYSGTSIGYVNGIYNAYAFSVNVAYSSSNVNGVALTATSLPTFAVNNNVMFSQYQMNYVALPPDLVCMYEDDKLPYDVQRLIPIHAAIEAEMRRSRSDQAQLHQNNFDKEFNIIQSERKEKETDNYNRSLGY